MPQAKTTQEDVKSINLTVEGSPKLLDGLAGLLERRNTEWDRVEELRIKAEAEAEEYAKSYAKQNEGEAPPDNSRNREAAMMERGLGSDSLQGSWFHRIVDGEIFWQGCIVGEIVATAVETFYIVELHNWVDGTSAHQRVVSSRDIVSTDANDEWRFYDSAEWMKLASARTKQHEQVEGFANGRITG